MTDQRLIDAYEAYTPGSAGFAIFVADECSYDLLSRQAAAIGERAATPEEFDRIWKEESWWIDATPAMGEPKKRKMRW